MPRPPRAKVASRNPTTTRVAAPAKDEIESSGPTQANQPKSTVRKVRAKPRDTVNGPAKNTKSSAKPPARKGTLTSSKQGAATKVGTTGARALPQSAGRKSAVEALRQRQAAYATSPSVRNASTRRDTQETEVSDPVDDNAAHTNRSAVRNARAQTPADGDETLDTDLYGLSPSGEFTQATIAARFQARRDSMHNIQSIVPALNLRATPAHDQSMLALQNFPRRARQSSILRTVQRQSMLDDSAFQNIDDFDLPPDDESTPLHLTRRRTRLSSSSRAPVSPPPARSSSRKRKRGSAVQVPNSPRVGSSPPPPDLARDDSPLSSVDSELPERMVTSTAPMDGPHVLSDTMADPMSSSILDLDLSDDNDPRARKRPHLVAATRNAQATNAPNGASRRRRIEAVSTTILESLLPRARRGRRLAAARMQDGYDLPSSDVQDVASASSDAEEGWTQPAKRQRGRVNSGAKKTVPPKNGVMGKAGPKARTAVQSTGGGVKMLAKSQMKKTYGRKSNEADKENDEGGEHSDVSDPDSAGSDIVTHRSQRGKSRPLEDALLSKEMEAARKKFEEVDAWDMDYESVGEGPTSSDWR